MAPIAVVAMEHGQVCEQIAADVWKRQALPTLQRFEDLIVCGLI
ncbi:hypothetical protein [Paucibacter soli]